MSSRASRSSSSKTRSPSKSPYDRKSPDSNVKKSRSFNKSEARSPAPETLASRKSALVETEAAARAVISRAPDPHSPSEAIRPLSSTQRSNRQGVGSQEDQEPSPLVSRSKTHKMPSQMGQKGQLPGKQAAKAKFGMSTDTRMDDKKQATDSEIIRGAPNELTQTGQNYEVPKQKCLENLPKIDQVSTSEEQIRKEVASTSVGIKAGDLKQMTDVQKKAQHSILVHSGKHNDVTQQNVDAQKRRGVADKPPELGGERYIHEVMGGAQGNKGHDDGMLHPKRSGRRKSATFAMSPLDDRAKTTASRGGYASFGSPAAEQSPLAASPSADDDRSKKQQEQDGTMGSKAGHQGYSSPPLLNSGTPPVNSRRQSAGTLTSKAANGSVTTAEGDSQWKTNPLLALILRASRPRKSSESTKKQRVPSTASSVDAESLKRRRATGSEGAAELAAPASPQTKSITGLFGQASPRLIQRHAVVMTPDGSASPEKRVLISDDESPPHTRHLRRKGLYLVCLAVGVIAAVVLAVFFGMRRLRMQRFTAAANENSLHQLCANEACKSLVYRLLSSSNASVDPCANFHLHVCGQWNHPKRGRGKRLSYLQENLTNYTLRLHKAFEEVTNSPALLDQAEHNMAQFYQSCHDFMSESLEGSAKESTVPEILREMGIEETSAKVETFQDVFASAIAESVATGVASILMVTQKNYIQQHKVLIIIDVGATLLSTLPQGYVEGYLDDSISQMPYASGLDVSALVKLDKNLDELLIPCEHSLDSLKSITELGEPFPGADWLNALNSGFSQNETLLYTPDSKVTVRGESCIAAMLSELHGVNVTVARSYSLLVMIAQIKKYALELRPWLRNETQRTIRCVSLTAQFSGALFLTWMKRKLVGEERSRAFAVMVAHLQEAIDSFSGLPEHLNLTANDYEVRHLVTSIIAPDVVGADSGDESGSVGVHYGDSFLLNVVRARRHTAGSRGVSTEDDVAMALKGAVTFMEEANGKEGGRTLSVIVPATFVTADLFVPEASEPALYYGSSGALLLLEWARAWLEGAAELREPIRLHEPCMQHFASMALGRDADQREALLVLIAGWALEVARSAALLQEPDKSKGSKTRALLKEERRKTVLRSRLFFYRFCSTTCGDSWATSACKIGVYFSKAFRHAFGCPPPTEALC